MDVVGQIRVIDRTKGDLGKFYDFHRKINAGQLPMPAEIKRQINDLATHNKNLIAVRITTAKEVEQLGLAEPAMIMESSTDLAYILTKIRHYLSKPVEERTKIE